MVTKLVDILKTARPRQWIKNLTLYAALVFTGNVLTPAQWMWDFWIVTEAIAAFTLIATAVYFLNDLVDIENDKAHPFKRRRPIASGKISPPLALVMLLASSLVGLACSYWLSPLFFWIVLGYFVMQVFYSLWLKNIEVVDVFVIALGFFLRVFAGAIVIDKHLSIWFLLCVISVSLFLAVGKRRAELAILTEQGAEKHRKVMGKYTPDILDAYLAMFSTAAFLSWALYTFNFYQLAPINPAVESLNLISRTLVINKWLMATIPVVIFGVMRYLRIVYDGAKAETPEKVILTDLPLLTSVAVWGSMVIGVLYLVPNA